MVAETHRLEQAARLSMGGFQEPDAEPVAQPPRLPATAIRYAVATLLVIALIVFLAQLF